MAWYKHPLVWAVGFAVGGCLLLRRRHGSLAGLAPKGGSILPPGLLARKLPRRPAGQPVKLTETDETETPKIQRATGEPCPTGCTCVCDDHEDNEDYGI